ncbi:AarF/ABC1/UbiB kinase family protein [Alteromonas sp. DY56-G5]|uniref:ABC1 kinase family protein n=1 Tax=Alteromonas TaxID=226 RepID=UPI001287C3C8|nr:AarF/ABC1/UbiB kinase family protein [Alteromonas macleodii]MCH2255147.1 AarF/ABC1/UbiB kinase family protein [Alteromonas sp.]MDM7962721.1 AarF/ABC1/UbiB kinase family protein [Alteromonas macleodii]MDM8169044.1 AarF/ABC1/UbiB kinase family protein [Alteromonas macleodii]CAI3970079.1 predicted unusual protein kinase regulating ubiquinone biosynthesis (AarF/ABC1/UbiB family) [Alteromonas macleodii]VTP57990.1 predicted unusual protein kinase regulating ubiquinone biosynthesis (AarF/ABC1/UbiB
MAEKPNKSAESPTRSSRAVPSSRLSRIGRLGSLAGRIAGNVVSQGAGQLLKGEKPALSSLLLTPKNISNIADQLASMRGAAMKLGQLISMDAGDFLPEELAVILGRLRDDADPMPKDQLIATLNQSWGEKWQDDLLYFSFAPIAAASIGQVHKVITMDGRMLAVKVQYPGVKKSIDSDVDNVATLIKLTGLVPKSLDINPLLQEAKAQLHQEADYVREADMLNRYRALVESTDILCKGNKAFVIPQTFAPLTTSTVLAMDFIEAQDLDALLNEPQDVRDAVMTALMTLFFNEIFHFKLLQSDPNLANYQFKPDTKEIVLLDFGATRDVPDAISAQYQALLNSAAANDRAMMQQAAFRIGLIDESHSQTQVDAVINIGMEACEAIRCEGAYDFGQSDLIARLHEKGMALTMEHNFWHTPPVDALFIHRKLGGLFLLAKRLKAKVDMRKAAGTWLNL